MNRFTFDTSSGLTRMPSVHPTYPLVGSSQAVGVASSVRKGLKSIHIPRSVDEIISFSVNLHQSKISQTYISFVCVYVYA